MGGGQALNFGLKYISSFAYVGAFSPALKTYSPGRLASNPAQVTQNMKFFGFPVAIRIDY
jgi:S-formylglutathione hydrolase FrmB